MIFISQILFYILLQAQVNKLEAHQLKPEIPVLCYHQVRNWQATDSKSARTYILPPEKFAAQMKLLADSGYHAITPDELLGYLHKKSALPAKPVILSFDDGTASQFLNAVPVINQYHFKAVFFLMTVSLNKSMYMNTQQVKTLSDDGFVIGCHSWDHHNVTGYANNDWPTQLEKPKQFLEEITGRPVEYFAYPNGIWNEAAITHLKSYNYKAAFQLADKQNAVDPDYTIRRIIVDGNWNAQQLLYAMKHSFK